MKLFECIVDDGTNVFKDYGTAKNKKDFQDIYGGNGEFIKITDISSEIFSEDSVGELDNNLKDNGWGYKERLLICSLLQEFINKNKK